MVCHFFQKRMHAPDFGRLLVELCRRKNTEMMEHLETKRGTSPKTEVDQPLVKNPKEPAWTLIGAIEQIVNLAIELKLETPFSEKAHSALTYVSECMSLDEEQALAFALFMEKSTDPRIQISDFSDLIGCRTVRIISLMAAADRLAQRHLIWRLKKENTLFYSVPMEVVEAVKENRVFEPAPIDNLTIEQLFDRMEKILDRMKEDRNLLLADLDALVAANPELPFCQTLQIYDLSEDVERLLFYVFCHLYVNKGKAYLRMRDWQDYFTGDEQRFLSWMMNASDLKLCERKIIEPYNANGLEDPEYFHLTRTAREALFVGLRYVEHKSRKGRDLLDCTTFAAKELFYNPSVQRHAATNRPAGGTPRPRTLHRHPAAAGGRRHAQGLCLSFLWRAGNGQDRDGLPAGTPHGPRSDGCRCFTDQKLLGWRKREEHQGGFRSLPRLYPLFETGSHPALQ